MKKLSLRIVKITVLWIYIAFFCFLVFSLVSFKDGIGLPSSVKQLSITGTASFDGGPDIPFSESEWPETIQHSLVIKGHFTKDIVNGDSLILWPRNLRLKLYVNDKLKISSGQRESFPSFIQYAGNSFQMFHISDVTTKDDIRIELIKAYDSCRINVINIFLENMYFGKEQAVYQSIVKNELYQPMIGIILALLGFFIISIGLLQDVSRFNKAHMLQLVGWFFIIGGVFYFYDSSYEFLDLLIPLPVLNTIVDLLCFPCLILFYLILIKTIVESVVSRFFMRYLLRLYMVLMSIPIILQFIGYMDLHELQDRYVLLGASIIIICYIFVFYEIIILRNRSVFRIMISLTPLTLCLILKTINTFLEVGVERHYLRIGILLTCILLLIYCVQHLKKTLLLVEQEQHKSMELQNAQIAIMLSQIHPHFLYNSLNTIEYICEKDGALAAEAINHLSRYLRQNMDSLSKETPIPFKQELDHIENYLYLQKLRFGDRINMVYNLEYTDFFIPTLTIQPIIENAIRHGITKQAQGGTVTLTTKLIYDSIWIIVTDDGIGFTKRSHTSNGRSHIGLENVKKRLQLQCDGILYITSNKDKGTQVNIRIKKNWNAK